MINTTEHLKLALFSSLLYSDQTLKCVVNNTIVSSLFETSYDENFVYWCHRFVAIIQKMRNMLSNHSEKGTKLLHWKQHVHTKLNNQN